MAGELGDAALEHANNRLGKGGFVEIDDVLNNVVPKWILDQYACMLSDALDQPELLLTRCVVDAALKHTAAVPVGANLNTLVPFADGIEDELGVNSSELVKTLLDDMIAVQILDELHDSITESLDDEMDLLRSTDVLNHLLQGSCPVLVQSNVLHSLGCVLDQNGSFVVIAELEELLAQIITKRIRHELYDMLVGLDPNHVNLIAIAFFQLLLEVATAVLIFAQLINLASK